GRSREGTENDSISTVLDRANVFDRAAGCVSGVDARGRPGHDAAARDADLAVGVANIDAGYRAGHAGDAESVQIERDVVRVDQNAVLPRRAEEVVGQRVRARLTDGVQGNAARVRRQQVHVDARL